VVVMKSSTFWVITPCSPLKVNRLHGVIWIELLDLLHFSAEFACDLKKE
jgi:hypothetical protein